MKSDRKARTRTLIQAGGLLQLLGFLEYCGIQTGEDLQLDFTQGDKAAALLGLLKTTYDALPESVSDAQWETWKSIGIRQLKLQKSRQYSVKARV